MEEELTTDVDLRAVWSLNRSEHPLADRFRLDISVTSTFTEPTAAEVTNAIAGVLERVFGPSHPDPSDA